MSTVHMHPTDDSPTRASARVTTRNAMLDKISDRVQQSQEECQSLPTNTMAQGHPNVDPSPQDAPTTDGVVKEASSSDVKTNHSSSLPKYDIETLFELGNQTQDSSKVLLKIQPEAIAENLFQYMGIEKSLRPRARSRGLSELTSLSHRSMMSSISGNEWEPSRQPRGAPQGTNPKQTSFIQQNEGFIRFLKQHASPPHHRVTAGGRIVPTGPLSPPPMFDCASLNGLLEGQPSRTQIPSGARNNVQDHHVHGAGAPLGQPKVRATYPAFQSNQTIATVPLDIGTRIPQNLGWDPLSSMPQPFAFTSLGFFPDGTALVMCNGICYRCFWNGMTTVMEPLTTSEPFAGSNEPVLSDKPLPTSNTFLASNMYGNVNPSTLPQPSGLPLGGGAAVISNTIASRALDPTANVTDSVFEENAFKTQLTGLDRYMALHHFTITPTQRTQLVSRRKVLVETIAKLRSGREPSIPTIPIVSSSDIADRKSSENFLAKQNELETKKDSHAASLNQEKESGNISVKKGLSPSAPAFVPKGAATTVGAGTLTFASAHPTFHLSNIPEVSAKTKKPGDGRNSLSKDESKFREASFSSEDRYSADVDPRDPAMRIVLPSMIEYAQKYEDANGSGAKKFCTTIEEFQEAIRRVREHAKMWGCDGGNSKDPAYDAEEDIWYAIKDEAPIPLPTESPDHIRCPRPWNWYNSLFNINAIVDPKILMRGSIFEKNEAHPEGATSTEYSHALIMGEKPDENIKDRNGSWPAKPSLHKTRLHEEQATAQGSVKLTDMHEDELSRHIAQHSFSTSQSPRKGPSVNGIDHITAQRNSVRSSSQRNGVAKSPFPNRSGPEEGQMRATYNAKTRNSKRAPPLAISAAKAVYSPKGTEYPRSRKVESYPRTPVSSPSEAKARVRDQETPGKMSAMPLKEVGELQANSSARGFSSQMLNQGTTNKSTSHSSLAVPENSAWDYIVSSDLKASGPQQSETSDIPPLIVNISKSYTSSATNHALDSSNTSQNIGFMLASNSQDLTLKQEDGSHIAHQQHLLKEMLKDSRYSLSNHKKYMVSKSRRTSLATPDGGHKLAQSRREIRFAQEIATREQQDQQGMEKENLNRKTLHIYAGPTSKTRDSAQKAFNSTSGLSSVPQMTTGPSMGKAISSMAPTTHHAQGFLPSYDGASKAQAASIHRNQTPRSSHNKPRANLPIPSSSNLTDGFSEHNISTEGFNELSFRSRMLAASSHSSTSRLTPAIFGYDGSEEPAIDEKAGMKNDKATEQGGESSERKGATNADFENHRPDHNNEWHRGEVNDFFRKLHEKEVKYMMARQRKNTKTAP